LLILVDFGSGEQGFAGDVISYVTYTLGDMTWDISIAAIATTKVTPIMMSSHVSISSLF